MNFIADIHGIPSLTFKKPIYCSQLHRIAINNYSGIVDILKLYLLFI